ncbi:MAG: hypothetical protein K2X32_12795 [Phycisphaerales bacterium]|nr:hypothetical protein [Phycisphaerales bacterium]
MLKAASPPFDAFLRSPRVADVGHDVGGMNGGFGGGENFVITSTSSEGSKKKAA